MSAGLLLQLGVILLAAQLAGRAMRAIGQPQVMGEMLAGILLGPSLLGAVAPSLSSALFPAGSLPILGALSEVGLVLFLFVVGLRHDPGTLHAYRRTAVRVSYTSIAIPFVFGFVLAFVLHRRLASPGVSPIELALFLGTAMSITAFPVLARIVTDLDLLGTRVGSLALVCAAVDDVTGWLILAAVLLVVGGEGVTPWIAVPGTIVYALLMLTVGRRALQRLIHIIGPSQAITARLFAAIVLVVLASACITEWLGVHPLFGAFLAGVAMPKEPWFVRALATRLEDVTIVLLLPVFFVVSGLRTEVGLLEGADMWLYFVAILVVAVLGKGGGTTVAARASGLSWREGAALGVLVNTRGLVELVLLNIGFEAGIVSPSLFTLMVLMALVTTFLAPPLFRWIYPPKLRTGELA